MSDVLTSAKNPKLKRVKKLLTNSSFRHKESSAVGEGVHIVRSYLDSGYLPETVVYAESALQNQEIATIFSQLDAVGVDELVVKDSLFESISEVDASVGVLIVFELPTIPALETLTAEAVILESVQDPGNLGTILRTAAAAGVGQVFLSHGSASAWSPKALRAGMGAQFSLDIHESVEVVSLAKNSKVPVLATDLSGAKSLYDTDLDRDVAWAFGNEGQGITDGLRDACTQTVLIPQAASAVESLNVAASVAVCLFEQRRQRSKK